ncbi:MAG: hypothetical protein AAB956_01970 [Patescibacteria group bacterium]
MRKKLQKRNILLFIFLISGVFGYSPLSYAQTYTASLYLSPSTGEYTVGNTFSIDVKVNTGGAAINAAEATLAFNPNSLEIVKLAKNNSIFALWTQEPVFSNAPGSMSFGGGLPSPI